MGLLRIYLTVGIALAGAATFAASSSWPVAVAAGAAIFPIALGSALCLAAMVPGRVSLPGRDPDFWLWALEVDRESAMRAYLENLQTKSKANRAFNQQTATALKYAKGCGPFALLAAAVAAAVALKFPV